MSERRSALVMPSVGFWFLLAAIASTFGIVRELWVVPRIGEMAAHQAGSVTVSAAFLALVAMFVRHFKIAPDEAVVIGTAWLAAAIAFEFGFGHYVDGLSWGRLLSDYDLTRGRLLLLVWITVGVGPFVLARVQRVDIGN